MNLVTILISQCFLCVGSMSTNSNAHTLVKEQLEDHLNRNKNLAQLIHILHETFTPLMSINKLPSIPHLNVIIQVRFHFDIFSSSNIAFGLPVQSSLFSTETQYTCDDVCNDSAVSVRHTSRVPRNVLFGTELAE